MKYRHATIVIILLMLLVLPIYANNHQAFTFIPNVADIPDYRGNRRETSMINVVGGEFQGITYQVTSTGARSDTTYRTSAIYISVGEFTFHIDSTQLMQLVPAGGQRITSQITINREQLLRGLNVPNDPATRERILRMMANPANIRIAADIQIMRRGEVIDGIPGTMAPEHLMRHMEAVREHYGFSQAHMNDWLSRFRNIPIPNQPNTPVPEEPRGSGLSPTIIVR